MEHAERERALRARHLVVVEFDRIYRAAAEFVVLGKGLEDGCEQNACAGAFGVRMYGKALQRAILS